MLFLYLGSHMEEEVESHAVVSCIVIIEVWGHIGFAFISVCLRFVPNFALLIVAAPAAGCHGNKMQDV